MGVKYKGVQAREEKLLRGRSTMAWIMNGDPTNGEKPKPKPKS